MALTLEDVKGLLRVLAQHPEARAELREMIVPPEMDMLRQALAELAEAQRRTEERLGVLAERMDALAERMDALAEAQRRTEERLGVLAERMDALAEAQRQMTAQLREVVHAQAQTEEALKRLIDVTGGMRGEMLELTYQRKAVAYFGPLLRGMRVVPLNEVADQLEDRLSRDLVDEILRLDLLLTGRPRHEGDRPEVWLAVEVSWIIYPSDVERAERRAAILRQAGLLAIPVVAGRAVNEEAEHDAEAHAVLLVLDGRRDNWSNALKTYVDAT